MIRAAGPLQQTMAITTQDELYRTFLKISGQQTSALSDATTTLAAVLAQMHEMQAADPTTAAAKGPATITTAPANSSSGALSSVASAVLKSGFGISPLIGGLISLFGGGDTPAPPPLTKYVLPSSIDFQAAETAAGTTGLDYDQSGMPRVYRAGSATGLGSSAAGVDSATSGGEATRQAPQITVNVQAMDARSFLDRSNDIALAVRDAMLNMNAINDVVNEL